jgi:hypothetical protein
LRTEPSLSGEAEAKTDKSFLLLFFKKEDVPSLKIQIHIGSARNTHHLAGGHVAHHDGADDFVLPDADADSPVLEDIEAWRAGAAPDE